MANNKHMENSKRGTKVRKVRKIKVSNLGKNVKNFFTKNSKDAKVHGIVLAFLTMLCIISGIFTFYLAKPAYELNIAHSESMKAHDLYISYTGDDEAYASELQQKDNDAKTVYNSALKSYKENSNDVIKAFAGLANVKKQLLVMIGLAIPFLITAIVAFKHPVKTVFSLINLFIIYPGLLIKGLIGNIRASIKEAKNQNVPTTTTTQAQAE